MRKSRDWKVGTFNQVRAERKIKGVVLKTLWWADPWEEYYLWEIALSVQNNRWLWEKWRSVNERGGSSQAMVRTQALETGIRKYAQGWAKLFLKRSIGNLVRNTET